MTPSTDDWNSWSMYLIKSIESLQERADSLEEEVHEINLEFQKELTKLKVYSKVASVIYSLVSAILISVIAGVITYHVTTDTEDTKPKTHQIDK